MEIVAAISSDLYFRAISLVVLVVLFQVCIARVPSLQRETKRRWQHALTGHILVQSSYILPKPLALLLLTVASIGMLVWRSAFEEHFYKAFGPLLRKSELDGTQYMPGAFYFLLGTAVTVWIVDGWTVPRYAVECLALADPVASWIGSTVPSPRINQGTSVSGCVACFATAFVVGWLMLEDGRNNAFTLSVGALACTIAEGLPFGNDNLNIPILTALAVDKLGRR
jgi:dolichol kinase